jgi:LAO/AO transport system kinase
LSDLEKFLAGDLKTLAKFISKFENYPDERAKLLAQIYPYIKNCWVIGITGPPGVGKSSLINALTKSYRKLKQKVGIIVIDPSSLVSGGAFLGDRIRMREHFNDEGVFIRSMATRQSPSGISEATSGIIKIMDAFGFDPIIIESIGVGQSEAELFDLVHTGILVQMPGLGDEMQALKAGILELSDIIVLNKKDLDSNDAFAASLSSWLPEDKGGWKPVLIKTQALKEEGIAELIKMIEEHRQYLRRKYSFETLKNQATQKELELLLKQKIKSHWQKFIHSRKYQQLKAEASLSLNPYKEVDLIYKGWLEFGGKSYE